MRLKVLLTTVLLLALFINDAAGENENYQVLSKGNNQTEIKVTGDCEIIAWEIVPEDVTSYIYGDHIEGKQRGNSLFNDRQVTPNKNKKGVSIIRDGSLRIVIKIIYSELEDKTDLDLFLTRSKTDNNISNTAFKISIIKCSSDIVVPEIPGIHVYDINAIKKEINNLSKELKRLNRIQSVNNGDSLFYLIVGLTILTLLVFYLHYLNNKRYKNVKIIISNLKKEIKDLKDSYNGVYTPTSLNEQSKDKTTPITMTNDEIKRFVVEQIKIFQLQAEQHNTQPSPTATPSKSQLSSKKKKETEQNTDEVKFHQGDFPYFTIEPTDIHIFKIYSVKGEYFYTIVDDSAIREEIVGMLQSFETCITYQTSENIAKRVEPVTPGKLRKEGDKYFVDTNNKLIVKFV